MEDPKWSEFQAPGGQFDVGGYIGPLAGAFSDAAKLATQPLTRMLEQVLASRLAEKSQLNDQRFASAQQERDIAARSMQQEQTREDQFAHDMLMAEQKRESENRAAMAFYGASGGGGAAPMTTSTGGVQPGTGPLSFENVYGAGPGGGVLDGVTPQQATAMGVGGLDRIVSQREAARTNTRIVDEQARDNAAKAAGEAAKAQAEMAAFVSTATVIDSAPLDPQLKSALIAMAQTDPDGAAGKLADILKPAPPRQKTADEEQADKNKTWRHNFGGGALDLPLMLRDDSEEYRVAGGAISKMPAQGKAALRLQAGETAMRGLQATNPMAAAYISGKMPGADPKVTKAYQDLLADRTDSQFTLLAQSIGWKNATQVTAEEMARIQQDIDTNGMRAAPETGAPPVFDPVAPPTMEERMVSTAPSAPDAKELTAALRAQKVIQSREESDAWWAATPAQRAAWLKAGRVTLPKAASGPAPVREPNRGPF